MKKLFISFFILLIVIFAAGVLALAYIGVVPGLSALFVKQVDLGIRPDPVQVAKINDDLGHDVELSEDDKPYSGMPEYEGSVDVSGSYSDQEVTSVLDSWSKNWALTPFYNVQVKIHADGTAEASGMLKVETAISLAKELGYSDQQIESAAKYATFINGDLPVYMMGTASVSSNQVSAGVSNLRIGTVAVPADITGRVVSAVEDAVSRRMQQVSSLDIQHMDLIGGKMNLSGTIPQLERGK